MRVDLFLRLAGVVKTRSMAGKACGAGAVTVDGKRARSSSVVREGSIIHLQRPDGTGTTLEVLSLPETRNVSRAERVTLYRLLDREPRC